MARSHRGFHRGHPRYARTLVTLAVAAGPTFGGSAASAQPPVPDDNAGTGQYVEPVPDAGGDRPSAPGRGGDGGSLPPSTRRALPPGSEGRQLESLATDPGSGAPAIDDDGSGGRDRKSSPISSGDDETAASSITSAVLGEDGPGVPILFLVLGGLTLGAAALAVRRRRRGGQS